MQKLIYGLLAVVLLAVAGCNSTATPSNATFGGIASTVGALVGTTATGQKVNNALASLSNNDLPAACGIVQVAEGYYTTLKSKVSAANQLKAAKGIAAADAVCANPPSNVGAAFVTLFAAWNAVQNATVAN